MPAADGDVVGHSGGREAGEGEGAHFDRVVDQFVIIGGAVQAERVLGGGARFAVGRRQRRGDAPVAVSATRRRLDIDEARRLFLTNDAQEDAGAVEEGVRFVEVGAAYRKIPGMDFAGDGERRAEFERRGLPGVLAELDQRHVLAARFGADGDDVAGEIADQVAARNPCRQGKTLSGRVARGNRAFDVEAVRRRVGRTDSITYGNCFHRQQYMRRIGWVHILRWRSRRSPPQRGRRARNSLLLGRFIYIPVGAARWLGNAGRQRSDDHIVRGNDAQEFAGDGGRNTAPGKRIHLFAYRSEEHHYRGQRGVLPGQRLHARGDDRATAQHGAPSGYAGSGLRRHVAGSESRPALAWSSQEPAQGRRLLLGRRQRFAGARKRAGRRLSVGAQSPDARRDPGRRNGLRAYQ